MEKELENIKNDLLKIKEAYEKCHREKEQYYKYFLHMVKTYNNKGMTFGPELSKDLNTIVKLSSDVDFYPETLKTINNSLFVDFEKMPEYQRKDLKIIEKAIELDNSNIKHAIFKNTDDLLYIINKYTGVVKYM
jgi:hypothetical protein